MGKANKKKLNDDIWDKLGEDIVPQNINENIHSEPLKNDAVKFDSKLDDLVEDFGGLLSTLKASSKNRSLKKDKKSLIQNSERSNNNLLKDSSIKEGFNQDHELVKQNDEQVYEIRLKTKSEKEKEKKEKEKAKKKAQSEKKKSINKLTLKNETETTKTGDQINEPIIIENGLQDSKNSIKKNKEIKAKKINVNIAAIQKQVELRLQAEEERRKQEEEERRIIEEEERKIQEEERRKCEAKLKKKEREKAKKEELKSQGKFLTKKQKEQKQMAQIKIQQLLATGVRIEGLVTNNKINSDSSEKLKRSVCDSKKKKLHITSEITDSNSSELATALDHSFKNDDNVEIPIQKINGETLEVDSEDGILDNWEEAFIDNFDNDDTNFLLKTSNTVDSKILDGDSFHESLKAQVNNCIKKVDGMNNSQVNDTVVKKEEVISQSSDVKTNQNSMFKKSSKNAKNIESDLRSPICCVLGHVDTGKTKILDKIRQTNVQEGEVGGITQQIGATYFPVDSIKQKIAVLDQNEKLEYKVPGLLIIDTPGHESFANLRSRGSSLCDIAILVVDIMHGLEPQTLESLSLLRSRKTPFIVALNKIDRIYGWNPTLDGAFQESLLKQKKSVQREYHDRYTKIIVAFLEQGLNAVAYYENKNFSKNVSIVPTSALTGEGIPDMLMLLLNLTQQRMTNRLMYLAKLEATVLEVKVIEGHGTTIDVILSNGILREGDRIVLCGLNGAIATNIRALLTPQPLKELRIKSSYIHNKEVRAASGVKISANDLDKAIAGSRLMVVGPDDDEEEIKEEVMEDLEGLLNFIDTSGIGVSVQASTLGSLEALLEFLKQSKIPVSGIDIGPVHKKDVIRCSAMIERAKEYAVMLCFDVKVDKDAEELAEQLGIKIFTADIIYHLFDSFTKYQAEIMEKRRRESASDVAFPCVLKTIAVFNKKDPILLGVDVIEGVIRIGTPICAVKINPNTQERIIIDLGRIVSIEKDHKILNIVKKGQISNGVAIKIECSSQILFGRQVDEKDLLYSHISRKSIDLLKDIFRDDVSKEEWNLIRRLKIIFGIT
ncbi:translation initiation factor aIF-2 [Pneumocystis murina B123]|uniref:Eukaryotic translation initiation factor 5B n=1 Tax=Pneumocystis murina (strain B123) TaxID=1069680 RepID=M7NTE9_PNEMU|nr:translation initiation factor aIF-2 [Pneumocystis murina B123]EMR10557.1 translation initiation factor aIF-2 [Pneumocystis murina B123]